MHVVQTLTLLLYALPFQKNSLLWLQMVPQCAQIHLCEQWQDMAQPYQVTRGCSAIKHHVLHLLLFLTGHVLKVKPADHDLPEYQ